MFFLMRDWFLDRVELRECALVLDVARESSAIGECFEGKVLLG